jgi:SNF2 family DNA or RNA helicase
MLLFAQTDLFECSPNSRGVAVLWRSAKNHAKAEAGSGDDLMQQAHELMVRLLEEGVALPHEGNPGVFLPAENAVSLDEDERDILSLPPSWPGCLRLDTHLVPNVLGFDASLRLVDERGNSAADWSLDGPILMVDGRERFLPTKAQFAALWAFVEWRGTVGKTEVDHLFLLMSLKNAAEAGCRLDLSLAGCLDIVEADECILEVTGMPDGSLELTPVPVGPFVSRLQADIGKGDAASAGPDGAGQYLQRVGERLHHLNGNNPRAIIRVGKAIILLDENQTSQARAAAKRRRVPPHERDRFRQAPEQWLADNVFFEREIEFLPRVLGIGEWKSRYLGSSGELGEKVDWFDTKPEPEKKAKEDREESDGKSEDGADDEACESDEDGGPRGPLVALISDNDLELSWGRQDTCLSQSREKDYPFDFSGHPRAPYPHQQEAVQWLAAHTARAGPPRRWEPDASSWGAGALLADDMGLGKTLSVLLFLGEWFRAWRNVGSSEPPACLVVAPLSLLENWKKEIANSFPTGQQPFRRVVVAIPDGELRRFYATENGRDNVLGGNDDMDGAVQKYGLRFGDGTELSLDQPGTCVLTTYQTLREFRFSFAGCDWSTAIFDEAQNLKNPNALQTIAAKSLKAFFRTAMTGTPVENHLGDLWSLMDAVEPGKLLSFTEFRTRWIKPLRGNPELLAQTGESLRQHLGALILRRTKEGELKGLPKKTIIRCEVGMKPEQARLYDEVLDAAKSRADESDTTRKNRWLASMWELRRISLHPSLLGDATSPRSRNAPESRAYFSVSGKLDWLVTMLDEIRAKGEKVLIFAVQKRLQQMLADHLGRIHGITVPVINGDTKAVEGKRPREDTSERESVNPTRQKIIDRFSETEGFAVCVLSPIAAGAGLNIQAANHVIHLERHWNPAKEDQATDRAYRIGQKRDVSVYLPLLIHPNRPAGFTTFDRGLDKLIAQKRALAGSLGLAPISQVSNDDLFGEVFGTSAAGPNQQAKPLSVVDAQKLSWEHFEALIAELYARDADEVILTPRGRDHGADVIILGHSGRNVLVQCKTTQSSELDSELAVREIEGARLHCENAVRIPFGQRCVHTNAARFSKRMQKAAKIYSVDLRGLKWLEDSLRQHRVILAQILDRNQKRSRI